jgi:hypothetical protein
VGMRRVLRASAFCVASVLVAMTNISLECLEIMKLKIKTIHIDKFSGNMNIQIIVGIQHRTRNPAHAHMHYLGSVVGVLDHRWF